MSRHIQTSSTVELGPGKTTVSANISSSTLSDIDSLEESIHKTDM